VPDGGHVVVCGLGNVGYRLVQELIAMDERVVALDKLADGQFHETVRRMGVPVLVGDATVPAVLEQARAGSAKAVIAATDSELGNIEVALLVREMNPKQRVVVRLLDPEFAEAVREAADLRYAISAPALAAPAFASALYGDSVLALVSAAGRTLVVVELAVTDPDGHLNGRSLRAFALDYGCSRWRCPGATRRRPARVPPPSGGQADGGGGTARLRAPPAPPEAAGGPAGGGWTRGGAGRSSAVRADVRRGDRAGRGGGARGRNGPGGVRIGRSGCGAQGFPAHVLRTPAPPGREDSASCLAPGGGRLLEHMGRKPCAPDAVPRAVT
jgi:Trk K+ transport system NAD-binding subunit